MLLLGCPDDDARLRLDDGPIDGAVPLAALPGWFLSGEAGEHAGTQALFGELTGHGRPDAVVGPVLRSRRGHPGARLPAAPGRPDRGRPRRPRARRLVRGVVRGAGAMTHLDTHVVVWLAGGATRKMPAGVLRRLRDEPPAISPMVALELDLLYEVGRVREPGPRILDHLEATIGLTLSPVPFASAVAAARGLTWMRDPFDRLIVGSALAQGASLVTADEHIRENYPMAVWG